MLAIYTCFFGNNENWSNIVPNALEGVDCYYFTNNPSTAARARLHNWKTVSISIPISNDNVVCAEQSKHLRCCPSEYPELAQYTYLCWIDSKLRITNIANLFEMKNALEASNAVWAFTRHPTPYTDVWGEYNAAIEHEKYARQKDRYTTYIESRLLAGYDEHKPQRVCCGFNIRKMTPLTKEIGSFWLSEIQECGIEDQISWQFVHQRYEAAILVVPFQSCWSYV